MDRSPIVVRIRREHLFTDQHILRAGVHYGLGSQVVTGRQQMDVLAFRRIREQRRSQYLLVSISALAENIKVTEQEIQDKWASQSQEEFVEASHILFTVKDPAKDAEVKAVSGAEQGRSLED